MRRIVGETIRKYRWLFFIFEAVVLMLSLWVCFRCPVYINVSPVNMVYEYFDVTKKDVRVVGTTLFGHVVDLTDKCEMNVSTNDSGQLDVSVKYGVLGDRITIEPVRVYKVEALYDKTIYINDSLDRSHVTTSVLYEDGYSMDVLADVDVPSVATEDCDVEIQTHYGTAVLEIRPVRVAYFQTMYNTDINPGELFDASQVSVAVRFENGASRLLNRFDILEDVRIVTGDMSIPISTEFGDTTLELIPQQISDITLLYHDTIREGEHFDLSKLEAFLSLENGETRDVSSIVAGGIGLPVAKADMKEVIETSFGPAVFEPDVVPIVSVTMKTVDNRRLFSGELIHPESFEVTYADNSISVLNVSQVKETDSWEKPVKYGYNTYSFEYNDVKYSFQVRGYSPTLVDQAKAVYAAEYDAAEYKYASDNTFLTSSKMYSDDAVYYLTHVVINSPEQIHGGMSYDDYAGKRELCTDASVRLNWVMGVNGGNFDYGTGGCDLRGVGALIKNGSEVYESRGVTNGREVCLTSDGELFSPPEGWTTENLLGMGVVDVFSCCDSELIMNGQKVNEHIVASQEGTYYPRCAVGMTHKGEYYFINSTSGSYSHGLKYRQVQDILWNLGCTWGKCFDGGGSSTLVIQNKLINDVATGSERPVPDFLYITDIPSDVLIPEEKLYDMSGSVQHVVLPEDGICIEDVDDVSVDSADDGISVEPVT